MEKLPATSLRMPILESDKFQRNRNDSESPEILLTRQEQIILWQ